MEHRYSLRFESGERRGETIPITGAGLTVGRKPGNTLQILDNSVSGSHAELVVGQDGVLLKDSGSTNGTRVGTQRVIEQQLSSGDSVTFGNVRMTFRDAQARSAGGDTDGIELEGLEILPDVTPAPTRSIETHTTFTPAAATSAPIDAQQIASQQSDGVLKLSPELFAKAKKRSFAGGIVVLAIAAVGAGLWFWLQRGGSETADSGRAVQPVAGNLVPAGYSFEGDDDTWVAAEGASAAFVRSGSARYSGAFGVSTDLDSNQWALHRSQAVRASAGHELVARAQLRTHGACEARVGIEFSNDLATDPVAPAHVVAWSAPVTDADGFQESEVATIVPPGWTNVRVVLLARSSGKDAGAAGVDADDASLVDAGGTGGPAASAGTAALYALGTPPRSVELLKGERVLVTHIATARAPSATEEQDPFEGEPVATRADGLRLFVSPAANDVGAMQMRIEEPLAHARVATIAKEGYTTHGLDFERSGVDALLFGSGADMVRVKLAGPSVVKGRAEGPATRITVVPAQALEMQLDFTAERKEAGNIAYAARASQTKGDLGAAIVQWSALLDGYPFEDALVSEAESARALLLQKGLADLRRVQGEIERARFFRLADLYRKCQADALAVGALYKGSEVEAEAKKLSETVAVDIAALEVDQNKVERERMRGILAVLEARKATGLAAEVRAYLTERLGDGQTSSGAQDGATSNSANDKREGGN